MELSQFSSTATGELITIRGSTTQHGDWEHRAFLPNSLPDDMPTLSPATIMALADSRAALAALDNTARQLPNPQLLRQPTLRTEAQSTSALEGTYAPLPAVITADEEDVDSAEMREIMNYVQMANTGYFWHASERPISTSLLSDLQGILMKGTSLAGESGRLRPTQVVIGRREGFLPTDLPVKAARFVPVPPGDQLNAGVDGLMAWKSHDHSDTIDPVIKVGMAHYQFETLHPFRDGNGRLGRYLIVLDLLSTGVLSEPTLTVSPWFEARRTEYYQRLLAVSTSGDWDGYLEFFLRGLKHAAAATRQQMLELASVQASLKEAIRNARIRADSAHGLIDLATARPTFTVKQAAAELGLSDGGARRVIEQLVDLKILTVLQSTTGYRRRYYAPAVLDVLVAPHD
ncbi:Fic family protein [Citricoccus zhacaiensis]|uniref:Fic family protein n=1 Tax=Citricoccus zhacaiensis TaxID=489142 RepID=UPI001E4A807A|nr:Fic/DOC family N-terminal domain-containing protein [Citricoccus zhacaiensis]